MAGSAPVLTVRRHFGRPPPSVLDAFRKAGTGWVVDANARRGALDYRIRPLTRATRFTGIALTVRNRARDNLAPYAAIAYARPGDVLVIADNYLEASVAGDVLLGMARNAGIVALVTDGLVRDIDGLNAVGIPVFAQGLSPNSPHKDGPGEIGMSVTIGGVIVESGDVIVGDENGVVVVARDAAERVAAAIGEVAAKESTMDEWVKEGRTRPPWLDPILESNAVQHLD
jgi:4-hydroxy-4-methyl-2-oxoglutarate aldolase